MKKIIFTLILATICDLYAFAYDFSAVCSSGQTLYYTITSSTSPYTVEVFGSSSLSGNLIIPSSVTYNGSTYSVTSIANSAFINCRNLTSVTIPNSVTSIGYEAFRYCYSLVDMTIPFVGGSATATTASASTLFGYIFGESTGGEIGTRQYWTSGNGPWYSIPGSLRSVTVTGGNLLYGAFYNCSMLTSVTIPNSVTSIGEAAFTGCSGLTAVYYTGSIEQWCGMSIFSTPLQYAHNLYIDNELVTDLVIPNTVTEIKNFSYATCLTSVTIPNSVVASIGGSAFAYCSGLTEVTIGNSVTSIGQNAFKHCSGLTEFTIPNSVTNIGQYAFSNCSGLTSITIGNGVESIGSSAFNACSGLVDMTIPFVGRSATATSASASTLFGYIFGTSSYTGGTAVEQKYGTGTSLTYYIPICLRSVTVTGGNLLYGAFYNCSMLTSVTIPNSVTSIGEAAFYWCSGLTSVSIPNSVTSIGTNAFTFCCGLMSVTFGSSVTSIGTWAFYGCYGLTDIYANPATPPTLGTKNFNYSAYIDNGYIDYGYHEYHYNATVWVPCGSADAYRAADQWSNFSDIRETGASLLSVSSANPQMGTASITLQPSCSNGNARIVATPNYGYRFVQWNDGNTDNPRSLYVSSQVEYVASFEAIPTYTITAVSADEATGTVTGGGIFYEGETATLTATPAEGYRFATWNDGNTDNPRTVTVTEDATYTATFAVFHTITVTSADETLGTASGSGDYAEGSQVEISATPVEHHHFAQWNDGNTDNPRTITVTGDSTFTASFAIDRFTITVESNDVAMGTVSESGTYDYDTEIQISATPAEGYGFATWNDGNTDNPRTITVTEDITYTATFGAWRTVTVASANETEGTVEGTGEYVEGTTIQITAIPNDHYHFVHWIDEENPTRDFNTDNPRTIIVTGNMTYTAVFAIDQHTITVESADIAMGTVSESGTYDYGTEIQISATAAEHYHFTQWSDGTTDNPRTIMVTEDATYRAEFAIDQHTITVESDDETMGTVNGSNTYDYGAEIQISATAAEHYHFVQWNDGNTDNPRTITVTEDATYRAEFAIDQHTITVESDDEAMGTVNGSNTYDYGAEIQISASALDGYQFVSWNDGNTDNPRTITVVADAEYIAYFISLTGIDESAVSEIALFPNPATDILNIASSETISEIEIVNVMGQVVKRIEVNADNAVCDVEDLKSGVYVVRIYSRPFGSAQGAALRKFIKE